jgi:hypothetical protein
MKKCLTSIGCAWLFLAAGVAAQAQSQTFSNAVMALNPAAYWPLTETVQPPPAPSIITNYGTMGANANGNVGVDVMALPGPLGGAGDWANAFSGIGFNKAVTHDVSSADWETWQSATSPAPPFTFECWANAYSLTESLSPGGYVAYTVLAADMSSTRTGWLIYEGVDTPGVYEVRTYNANGTTTGVAVQAVGHPISVNQWHHVVMVFDANTNISLYLNGALVAGPTSAAGGKFVPNNGASAPYGLTLGQRGGTSWAYQWQGAIAEAAYYTNALDATTIANHYAAVNDAVSYSNQVVAANPIIYLKMDEQAMAPVATNYGRFGAAADGYYDGGTLPGSVTGPSPSGSPAFNGFPSDSTACAFGEYGQVETNFGPGVQLSTPNPRLLNVTNSFSITAFAQVFSSQANTQMLWGQGESSYFLTVDSTGYPHFGYGSAHNLAGTTEVTDGAWHFFTGTYNSTNGSAVLYIDGAVAISNVWTSVPSGQATYPFIGGSSQIPAENFVGNMAHVALFTNALTYSQVTNLMAQAINGACTGPVVKTPILPSSFAECWSNSTHVFTPLITDTCGTVAYSWTLNSTQISTNTTLAFSSIPGLVVGNNYTLTVTGTDRYGSVSSSVQLQIDAPPAVAATLYADSFSRSGELNGSQPDVANAFNASWLADVNFKCNGSALVDTSANGEAASLPFIPQSGHVYVLSSVLNPLNSDDNYLGLGYGVGSLVNSYTGLNNANFEPWLLARGNRLSANSGAEFYVGPGTSQGQASSPFDLSGPSTYQIVLDTTQSSWTTSFYEDGILQYGPVTFFSNPGIVSVFAANSSTGDGTFASFKLTDSVLPAAAPAIVQDLPATFFVLPSYPVTLTVAASGAATLSYQWQFNSANLGDTTRIKGSRTNTLTILAAQAGDAGSYQVIVTNVDGSASSAVCVLSVGTVPNINDVNSGGWSANNIGNTPNTPVIGDNLLTLTDGNGSECESVFFANPQYIGAFTASFTYQAIYAGGGGGGIGDGASFILQNDPRGTLACGAPGGTLGFAGYVGAVSNISPSVALCLNTYSPIGYSWNDNGDAYSPVQVAPGSVNLQSGDPINITVSYASGTVAITLVDTNAQTSFSTNLHVGDITSVLGTNTAYVGFGGSEGYATSLQTITNFMFTSIPLSISVTPTNWALLTWPQTYAGYVLQQSSDLSSPSNWVNVTSTATLTNGLYQIVVPTTGSAFYRLNVLQ